MDTSNLDTLPRLDWASWDRPFLFFTGKGGVGKTTIASTVAVSLTDAGHRVLLVSTDPASNLGDVFNVEVKDTLTEVPGLPRLRLVNVDPHQAAENYRLRVLGPYQGVVPEADFRAMEEQLSGACTVEIASFDEFTRLLTDPTITAGFDHVIFDTAPTGHTLRLLSLPSAWSGYLEENVSSASCLGPLAGLEAQRDRYIATVNALADDSRTTLVLVSRADDRSLREAARAGAELAALGIRNQRLILNGILSTFSGNDPVAAGIARLQSDALLKPAGFVARATSGVGFTRRRRPDRSGCASRACGFARTRVDARQRKHDPFVDTITSTGRPERADRRIRSRGARGRHDHGEGWRR